MYAVGLKLKLKPEQLQAELPQEIEVTLVDGESIHVTSEAGTFESSKDILDAFYVKAEELTLESLPKTVIEALAEVIALFDVYAATQSALAGIQVKTKLLTLKDSVARVSGHKSEGVSLLGRKIS
jgi:hypothetical protein